MRLPTNELLRPSTSSNTKIQHIGYTMTTPTKFKKTLNMKMHPMQYSEHNLYHDRSVTVSARLAPVVSVKLSEKWMDYQGMKNWEGMLNPLDETLRGEILRYGFFVEAAYQSCDFDPSSSTYAMCRYNKQDLLNASDLSGTGYRVTKNLTVTSGIELPSWAEQAPNWMAMQSSWIGYVAVCQDKGEILRLGRRDIVIAFRGTVTCLEWLENLRATLAPLPNVDLDTCTDMDIESGPMVERGFLSLYTSNFENRSSLQTLLREEIAKILEKYGNEPLSFTITGHSLGAALATLAAYDIKESFKNSPLVTVISFAGPRVGNLGFRCKLEEHGTKVLRIVNSDDLITKVPGFVMENNERIKFSNGYDRYIIAAASNLGGWLRKVAEDAQWVYADVGCELRLSSRGSPFLNGFNFATCHDLKTYLHLVDGFVSSNYPFR